jgi:predicted restriction endonuclease
MVGGPNVQYTMRDLGYTVYSRYEEALRRWLRDRLVALFDDQWQEQIPSGIQSKILDKLPTTSQELGSLEEALRCTDLPDLMEVACYRKGFTKFLPEGTFDAEAFRKDVLTIYDYRCRIAHVDPRFTRAELTHLVALSEKHLEFFGLPRCVISANVSVERSESRPPRPRVRPA